jgi:uncharacterized surface protein with fasciclin (FAS1) repeats
MMNLNFSFLVPTFVFFISRVTFTAGQSNESFASILNSTESLSFAANAIAVAKLKLPTDGSTIFAPNNEAFMSGDPNITITSAEVLFQPNYIAHLQNLLLMHVVDSRLILSDTVVDGGMITAANSESILVSIPANSNITLSTPYQDEAANIVVADIMSSDGVLYQIDRILYPLFVGTNVSSRLLNSPDLIIFYELLQLSGLEELFGRDATVTMFVPTDDTLSDYESYLRSNVTATKLLLSAHIVTTRVIPTQNMTTGSLTTLANTTIDIEIDDADSIIFVNTEQILQANVLANNGIIHVIDFVFNVPGIVFPAVNKTPTSPTGPRPPAAGPTTSTSASIKSYLPIGYVMLTSYIGWCIFMF